MGSKAASMAIACAQLVVGIGGGQCLGAELPWVAGSGSPVTTREDAGGGFPLVDDVTIDGFGLSDEPRGVTVAADGTIWLAGYLGVPGQGRDIWLAAYDTNLGLIDSITLNGPVNGEDVAYGLARDEQGNLFLAGVYSEASGGANVWLAEFTPQLELRAATTVDGPAHGYDSGMWVATGGDRDLYLSALIEDPFTGFDIWLAHYRIPTVFDDDFESGDTTAWSVAVP